MSNNDQWTLEKVSYSDSWDKPTKSKPVESKPVESKPKENTLDYKEMNKPKPQEPANTLNYKKMNKPQKEVRTLDYSKFNEPKKKPAKVPEAHETLSQKWSKKTSSKIPEDHPDRKKMIQHVNKLHQAGKVGEASRLYDMHITGGGSYTKGLKKCLETLNTVLKKINASD
jgi:hypothetical protein